MAADILRHGAYVCLHGVDDMRSRAASPTVASLAERLGFGNEFDARDGHPAQAIAFVKRTVHVAASDRTPVDTFCAELARLLDSPIVTRVLRGVVRPTVYTSGAMHEFAYAHQVVQQPGNAMPNVVLIPMNKTPEWWAKDWMERHTYFLPRYDAEGRMLNEGHALAAAAGIPCIMRRTYKSESQPAPPGTYEFVNYFECADADVPTLEAVVANLRDVQRNPEWSFVREGPTWRGRRVPAWSDLFA
jgi:hypothetical protein